VGGIVGAIVGTLLLASTLVLTLVGTIAGGCIGAGIGAVLGDRWAGRTWRQASTAGRGAAVGKLFGTMGKVAVAATMWAVILLAVVLPWF
jgi:hypothetical protein